MKILSKIWLQISWFAVLPVFFFLSCPSAFAAAAVYSIDNDGDGYGVGIDHVTGPDADDTDPLVNTFASIFEKYPSLPAFLAHRGISAHRLIYISPEGDDETGRIDDIDNPFASWSKIARMVRPGDTIVFRKGVYKEAISLKNLSGTKNAPITIMACPGEAVVFENCGKGGNSAGISLKGGGFLNIDGIIFDNKTDPWNGNGVYLNGTTQYDWGRVHDISVKNIEVKNTKSGVRGMINIDHLYIENCVLHDTASHNIYIGTSVNDLANSQIFIRRNLVYRGAQKYDGLFGIQHNGIVDGLFIEENICHSSLNGGGISLVNGAVNTVIRGNLIHDNGRNGIVLYGYQAKWGWHLYNNQIIDNIIHVGETGTSDSEDAHSASGILLNDTSGVFTISGTVIKNNIISAVNGYPVDIYQEAVMDTTIIEKNKFYRKTDSKVIKIGENAYKIKKIQRKHRLIRENVFKKPGSL